MAEPILVRQILDVVSGRRCEIPYGTPCLVVAYQGAGRPHVLRVVAHHPLEHVATVRVERGRGETNLRVTGRRQRHTTVPIEHVDTGAYAYVRSEDFDDSGYSAWWLSRCLPGGDEA